ncbi:putative alkaline dihydroceramidase Ydc1 [Emericellopsis atlantica]|uniref:Alkaline dihydroceramidase Ydc1 n=1 Tax=Emericellopsis atlantica TaxID=2614577 RepID=A0A9P7ZFR6_9HYPO|nr:putative alkaline dihydroceramidase Ydc1 [Emericellopsis atlantica]KAG9250668.1 putative alkaline dihydroceramidase Ydc1 [Emericellopsis atlantica]
MIPTLMAAHIAPLQPRAIRTKLGFHVYIPLFLGIGSFLFHASLRQTLEYADELAMIGIIWSVLQATLSIRQSTSKVRAISVTLTAVVLGFSVFYVWSANILYHVLAFSYLFWWTEPGFPREKARDWNKRTWPSLGACLVGYVLWNIDLECCTMLRNVRQLVGLPWPWLLEFHGWWHILTGIGAGRFMNVAREMREECRRGKEKET